MLRPERMEEVALLVRTSDARRVIDRLADERALHLIDHRRVRVGEHDIDLGKPGADADALAQALINCRALLAKLPAADGAPAPAAPIPDLLTRVNDVASRFAAIEKERDDANTRIETLTEKRTLLAMLPPDTSLDALRKAKSVRTALLRVPQRATGDPIARTGPLARTDVPAHRTALVTWRAKDADAALRDLERTGVERLDLGRIADEAGTANDAIARVTRELAAQEERRAAAQQDLDGFRSERAWLAQAAMQLQLSLLRAQAPLHFGTTKRVTIIRGFTPEKRMAGLQQALADLNVPLALDVREATMAPTSLDNPKATRPFEALLSLYSLPHYREIDPTSLMAITFPLFFGFMLGDIGYGAALLIAALLIRKAHPKLRDLTTIIAISAVSAIAFGALFGEVFGLEAIAGVHLPSVLHRGEDPIALLGIAALIGMIHVTLGFILGIVNESKDGILFGLLAKGGWLCLGAGSILLLASQGMLHAVPLLRGLSGDPIIGSILAIVGVIMILWHERMRGLLELPMLFSHVLSYLRLAAIGLSSVALALVVNDMGGSLVARGGPWMALGIIVILIGHTINLLLGLLGPFLHSLRLHYAEFFMKFYEGGGIRYRPFGVVEDAA